MNIVCMCREAPPVAMCHIVPPAYTLSSLHCPLVPPHTQTEQQQQQFTVFSLQFCIFRIFCIRPFGQRRGAPNVLSPLSMVPHDGPKSLRKCWLALYASIPFSFSRQQHSNFPTIQYCAQQTKYFMELKCRWPIKYCIKISTTSPETSELSQPIVSIVAYRLRWNFGQILVWFLLIFWDQNEQNRTTRSDIIHLIHFNQFYENSVREFRAWWRGRTIKNGMARWMLARA